MSEKQQFLWHEVQGVEASAFAALAKEAEAKYGELLLREHVRSTRHTPLSDASRAAQFAPFAALTGYDDAVEETARFTDGRIELDEQKQEELDALLSSLVQCAPGTQRLRVSWFEPDERKEGGAYRTKTLAFRRVDALHRVLESMEGDLISLDDIVDLERMEEDV